MIRQRKSVAKNRLRRTLWRRESLVCKGLWREWSRLELRRRELGRTARWLSHTGIWNHEKNHHLDWITPEGG